jgi:ABC-type Fe3+-hydroxamate transport system substrate-binding protein
LIGLFNERLSAPRRDTFSLRPKVLFCVGRDNPGGGRIAGVFVAGKATFYDDLIRAAGGRNALEAWGQAYARLSMEGVLAAAPDIVIDIAPAMESGTCDHLIRDWQAVDRLPAVAGGQVHCMSSDYCTVPGPRLLLLFDDLQRIIAAFCRGKKTAS